MGGIGSGGHARSGPPPDPNALRRDRDAKDWVTLPSTGIPEVPEWPLVDPTTRELDLWKGLWTRRPQAHMWVLLGLEQEVAMYVRRFAEAEIPGSPVVLGTLVRQLGDSLGLTTNGLRVHRWKITGTVESPTAPSQAKTSRRRTTSSRDRLKVVRPPA